MKRWALISGRRGAPPAVLGCLSAVGWGLCGCARSLAVRDGRGVRVAGWLMVVVVVGLMYISGYSWECPSLNQTKREGEREGERER